MDQIHKDKACVEEWDESFEISIAKKTWIECWEAIQWERSEKYVSYLSVPSERG